MSKWVKGQSGNPKGRPKRPELEELRKALDAAKKTHNKSLLEHFAERAYENDAVLIALAKKVIPDKVSAELDVEDNSVTINILRLTNSQTPSSPLNGCKQIESKPVDNAIARQLGALPKAIEDESQSGTG